MGTERTVRPTPTLHHFMTEWLMEATDQNKNRAGGDGPAEIERLQEELRREHDMYLRALADFENYRTASRARSRQRRAQRKARHHTSVARRAGRFRPGA